MQLRSKRLTQGTLICPGLRRCSCWTSTVLIADRGRCSVMWKRRHVFLQPQFWSV